MQKLVQMAEDLAEIYDDMRAFSLDPYLLDRGIVVRPEYRGLGIAQELLKVRFVLILVNPTKHKCMHERPESKIS